MTSPSFTFKNHQEHQPPLRPSGKTRGTVWVAFLVCVLTTACGQRGALYLPEPPAPRAKPEGYDSRNQIEPTSGPKKAATPGQNSTNP